MINIASRAASMLIFAAVFIANPAAVFIAKTASAATVTSTPAATLAATATPAEAPAPAEKPAAKPKKLFEKGFTVSTDDNRFELRLKANVQANARYFVGDDANRAIDQLLLRRVRPQLEGRVFGFATFRVMPDFGNGRVELFDAYADLEAHPALRLRVGKTKANFGLERLQSQTDLIFVERSQANGLVPNRDVGAQVHGLFLNGAIQYSAGIWNGVADGASGDVDADDRKDYIGRVFIKPFRLAEIELLNEVGLGISASHGIRRGSARSPLLPSYRSPAQQAVFTYSADSAATAAGTTIANGPLDRFSPQAAIYIGPVGLMAEYVHVSQQVKRGNDEAKLIHDGYQITASVVLTGEKARYNYVDVAEPASFEPFQVGAFEIAVRFDRTAYSRAAFGRFVDVARSYTDVTGYWAGFNWYLNGNVKITGDFTHAELEGGTADMPTSENAVHLQTQLQF